MKIIIDSKEGIVPESVVEFIVDMIMKDDCASNEISRARKIFSCFVKNVRQRRFGPCINGIETTLWCDEQQDNGEFNK